MSMETKNEWGQMILKTFVDVLFGTLKDEKEVGTSQTEKDLEKRA
ncbi:MAG: hypothetical protein ACQEWI_07545 [Bacillota bacterium]